MGKTLKAGVARANITPSVGQDNMADYLRLVPARGVGNELYAKALVLDDGAERVAIVTADIISFPDSLVSETRERIEKLTGISGEKVLLSASHTHSSPAVNPWDRPAASYLTELSKKVAGAVYMADQEKQEALVGCGVGEAHVAVNRWQKTPTGVQWGPNPDGPMDPAVGVLRVDRRDGRPIAILVNYASHPTILGSDTLLYSGDYVSYVQSVVEEVYGGETMALFATGAGGDIKIAVLNEDGTQFRYGNLDDCRRFGTMFAAEAIEVAEGIETRPLETVSAKTMEVTLPLCELPSTEEVQNFLEQTETKLAELEQAEANTAQQELRIAWAKRTLAALQEGSAPSSVRAEVQLIRIGPEIAFFAVPGELFVEAGMAIKQALGLPGSFVVAYANGGIGYLPSRRAQEAGWCDNDLSYRITTRPANFSGAIEDVLVEAATKLLSET